MWKRVIVVPLAAACLGGALSQADGEVIEVPNGSFELPVLAADSASLTEPENWTWNGVGDYGYVDNGWNSGAIEISNLDGNQAAWFNTRAGSGFHQVLSEAFAEGNSYRLTVGAVKASPAWTGSTAGNTLSIELYYGDFEVVASASVTATELQDSRGALIDLEVVLPVVAADDAWAGQSIGIRLVSSADFSNGGNDWAIDDVRLESTSGQELIAIPNASFELPGLEAGNAAVGEPTGWSWTGVATRGYVANGWGGGAINLSNLDGTQAAWFNSDVGNGFFRTLPTVFELGRSYDLSVAVAKASPAWTGSTDGNEFQLQLYYGDFQVIASAAVLAEEVQDSQDALTILTASLSEVQATDAWFGQPIGIRLISTIDESGAIDNDWAVDDVRLLASPSTAPGTLSVASPVSRQVIQRDESNKSDLEISGTFTCSPDRIEARLIVMDGYDGTGVDWTTLDESPSAGTFSGMVANVEAGGWYQLELRAIFDEEPGAFAIIQKVGVGDVYLVSGQSNSANFGWPPIVSSDDRVSAWDFASHSWTLASDPMPGSNGNGGSPWTRLGPMLVERNQVPVAFGTVGIGGTRVDQWVPGAELYPRIQSAVKAFPAGGFRAMLWHQGEFDSQINTTTSVYAARLESIIEQSREDAGWDFRWYIAEASYIDNTTLSQEEPVVAGQRAVIHSVSNTYPGSATDDFHLEGKLSDTVHFNETGLTAHASQWLEILSGSAPVALKNGDFESNLALADGSSHTIDTSATSSPSVIGWRALNPELDGVAEGSCGYYNPDDSSYPGASTSSGGTVPGMDGPHVGFISGSPAGTGFLQTRSALLEAGKNYTLSAALGIRAGEESFAGAILEIRGGSEVLASRTIQRDELDALNAGDAAGKFTEVELTYRAPTTLGGDQALSIRIAKLDGSSDTYVDFDHVRFVVEDNSYGSWQQQYFAASDDPAATWEADPDGDGYANGIEYYLGTNPTTRDELALNGPVVRDGKSWVEWALPLNEQIDNSLLELQYSFDLESWFAADTLSDGSLVVSKQTDSYGIEVAVEDHPKVFFRLVAEVP
ncbi:hypothetical protein JIN85_01385 [Luteolibacter pohnpeiensis]|uniref:Sialate O-acetylesterase domain-containing protein n=1 Tax=Luteolibacter pohnpeiensis TaxID=454153 RepID=A0A934VUE1_9BACT|nr:sialate O-acetylesterase [Luteolibacter pohnpeiensis]MBK1881045.1 hypothetical protein [Luteolibacter pohnpeiensis]